MLPPHALTEEINRLQTRLHELKGLLPHDSIPLQWPELGTLLSNLVDAFPFLLSYIDASHHYRFINQAYEHWFDLPRHEILGKHLRELHGEQTYKRLQGYFRWAQSGQTVTFEHGLTFRDKGSRYFRATYVPDLDKGGNLLGFFVAVFDITDRKVSEVRLKDLERDYKILLDEAEFGLCVTNETGFLRVINNAALQLFGYPEAELKHRSLFDLIDDRNLPVQSIHSRFDRLTNLTQGSVFHIVKKDKSHRPVLIRMRKLSGNRLMFVLTSLSTTFELEQTESVREQRCAKALQALPDFFFEISADESVREIVPENHPEENFFPPFTPGIRLEELMPTEVYHQWAEALGRARATEQVQTITWKFPSATGELFFEIRLIPMPNGEFLAAMRNITNQQRTEAVLRTNEHRLQALVRAIDEVVYEFDREGLIVNLWTTNEALLPISQPEAVGSKLTEIFTPEVSQRILAAIQEALDIRQPVTFEYPVDLPDGQRWFLARLCPVQGEKLPPQTVCQFNRDITHRKRSEEALRQNMAYYQGIVEENPYMICRFGVDGSLSFVNRTFCRYFGTTADQLVTTSIFRLVHPDDRELVRLLVADFHPGMPVLTVELRVVLRDGTIHWNRWSSQALSDETGKFLEYQGIGEDITFPKHLEEELQKSRNLLNSFFDNIPFPVHGITPDHRYFLVNRAWEEVAQKTRHEVLGHTKQELFPLENVKPFIELDEQVLATRQVCYREAAFENESIIRYFRSVRFPLYNEHHGVEGVGGATIDVTDGMHNEHKALTLRSMFELSSEAFFEITADGDIVDTNETASEMFGFSKAEFEEIKIQDLSASADAVAWAGFWKSLRPTGRFTAETRKKTKHGTLVLVLEQYQYWKFGHTEGCYVLFHKK